MPSDVTVHQPEKHYTFVVFNQDNTFVAPFHTMEDAIDFAVGMPGATVLECETGTQRSRIAWRPDLTHEQLMVLNSMRIGKFHRTKPEAFRRAANKFMELKGIGLPELARMLNITQEKLRKRLG